MDSADQVICNASVKYFIVLIGHDIDVIAVAQLLLHEKNVVSFIQ